MSRVFALLALVFAACDAFVPSSSNVVRSAVRQQARAAPVNPREAPGRAAGRSKGTSCCCAEALPEGLSKRTAWREPRLRHRQAQLGFSGRRCAQPPPLWRPQGSLIISRSLVDPVSELACISSLTVVPFSICVPRCATFFVAMFRSFLCSALPLRAPSPSPSPPPFILLFSCSSSAGHRDGSEGVCCACDAAGILLVPGMRNRRHRRQIRRSLSRRRALRESELRWYARA